MARTLDRAVLVGY